MQALHEIQDVISAWKISERTLRRMIGKGELKCIRLGSLVRFTDEQLQDYLSKRTLSNKRKK